MKLTWLVPKAANVTESTSAASVVMRPVCASPSTTAMRLLPVCSHISFMRPIRNSS